MKKVGSRYFYSSTFLVYQKFENLFIEKKEEQSNSFYYKWKTVESIIFIEGKGGEKEGDPFNFDDDRNFSSNV